MKVFKQLSPRQIARYIKGFHCGHFTIESQGIFEFRAGRVNLNNLSCAQKRQLARQLNRAVSKLDTLIVLPD